MRIETPYKVLLGIIVIVAIIGQVKDNIVSKNEIEKCYKENYTFVYKQETLSDNLIKQFLSQLNEYNYSEEKDKKDSDEYQFVDSIFIPERKIVLQANHKSKTVQIARIKIGSREYENAQILYQHGYQILHDKKKLSEKEIKKKNDTRNAIMIAENLIKNKGFQDLIIFINGDSISIIVKAKELKEEQIAQIQNIISRELKGEIENIHISNKE